MSVALIVVVAVVLLAAEVGGGWLVRARAARIQRSEADKPERVHRLQRLLLATMAAFGVAALVVGGLSGALAAAARHHKQSPALAAAVFGAGVVGMIVAMIVGTRAIRRALAAVRETPMRSRPRRRQVVAGIAVGLFWAAAIVLGRLLVPGHGAGRVIGMVAVYLIALLLLTAVVVPLVPVRLSSRPLTGPAAQRLARLADEAGVRVRGFRVLDTRGQKIANAAQVGTVPGFRYVLLTDYLLDNLPPDEVDAVVAHELGHARRHHLAVKLAAVLAVWAVLEAAAAGVGAAAGHGLAALLAAPIFIAIPVGMFLTQGLLGVRLERAADDQAAHLVGADELARALERIADLNDAKRSTGRGWALITQHPGVDDRLRRLRTAARRPAAHA